MKTKGRTLALALAVCLLLGMALYIPGPVAVYAESGCSHVHNEACGYVEGAPCQHVHDEDCGEDGADCPHVHDEDCGYIEAAPCTHEHDGDCGGLAGNDNGPTLGESGPATPTQIAAFAPLDDTVRVQGFDLGDVTLADLVLPETLEATDEDDAPLTVEGVTWACTDPDTGFDAAADGLYTFTPELPGGYTLADGVALPEITVIIRPDGPAIMPMNLNTDLAVGTWAGNGPDDGHRWVEFGGILWRVLEVKDNDPDASGNRTALLLAEEAVDIRRFHTTWNAGDGNWVESDIRAWLNSEVCTSNGEDYTTDGFLSRFNTDEQAAIVTTKNYTLGGTYNHSGFGGSTTDNSKVFLLSVDEVENSAYFADNDDRNIGGIWWLRSPGGDAFSAAYVISRGVVYPAGGNVSFGNVIRPALKINLASSIFTSENPLYEVKVTVESGGSPVAGTRVSFSGASAPVAKFSNANGEASWYLPNGTYNITASLLGYEDKTVQVTVNNSSAPATIDLNLNTEGLPFYIRFGQSGGTALNWRLVDLDRSAPEALLLAEDYLMDGNWLAVHNWINETGNGSGGFLEEGEYFTAAELDAMTIYSETTTKMFLLSRDEVEQYFPHEAMRYFPSGSTSDYWLRSGDGSGSYDIVNKGNGSFYTIDGTSNTFDARPAVWLDLTRLVQREDSGVVRLVPAYAATVEVKAAGGQSINGANVTLTLTSGETYRLWDGAALDLDGTTSSGSAAFTLPAGTYEVTATATGYSQRSGTITLTVGSGGNTATVVMDASSGPAPGDTIYFGSEGGAGTTYATDSAMTGQEWVVLDNDGSALWLFAADVLFEGGSVKRAQFHGSLDNKWSSSDLHGWLNGGYLTGSFTGWERDAILLHYYQTELGTNGSGTMETNQSHIFLLDLVDVQSGGAAGSQSLLAASDYWWLRSPGGNTSFAAFVDDDGVVYPAGDLVSPNIGIRPAFRFDLASVLFTSDVSGTKRKSQIPTGDNLVEVADLNTGAPQALTLRVDDMALSGVAVSYANGRTLRLVYDPASAETGANQYLSCLLLDGSDEALFYGKLEHLQTSASGTATVYLSGLPDGSYTLQLFNEQVNGDYDTDYAGTPVEIPIQFSGGVVQDTFGPIVTATSPANGATNVPVDGRIAITFNKGLDRGAGSVTLSGGVGTLNSPGMWSADHTTYTIGYSGLANSTTYTIGITGFTDSRGNPMIPPGTPYTFTTEAAPDTQSPSVVSVTPSGSGAALNGNIVVTFDEAMNTGAGSVTLSGGAGTVNAPGTWSTTTYTNDTYTIGYSGLDYSTAYTIGITGFADVAGNPMNVTGPHTFTTVALGQAATPVANPPGGAYSTAQTVTLTSATTGAAIYYTLDGSDPTVTTNSARTLYATPITVPLGATLKAYATATGLTDSAVLTAVYTQDYGGTGTTGSTTGSSSPRSGTDSGGSYSVPTGKATVDAERLGGYSWRVDLPFLGFLRATVDGDTLTRGEDYTVRSGSTVLTLTDSYVNSLRSGSTHTLRMEFLSAVATVDFTVTPTGTGSGNVGEPGAPALTASSNDNMNPSTGGVEAAGGIEVLLAAVGLWAVVPKKIGR